MDVDTDGHLRVVKKARSRQRSLHALADETIAAIPHDPSHRVLIATADAQTPRKSCKIAFTRSSQIHPITIGHIGAAIASHTGLGCVAVFSLDEKARD
jgi:fatty acid-binding protein DegV